MDGATLRVAVSTRDTNQITMIVDVGNGMAVWFYKDGHHELDNVWSGLFDSAQGWDVFDL